jgi:hypothetical protein
MCFVSVVDQILDDIKKTETQNMTPETFDNGSFVLVSLGASSSLSW